MSTQDNKSIASRWFTQFCGSDSDPEVIDEIAAPDSPFEHFLHALAARPGRHSRRRDRPPRRIP